MWAKAKGDYSGLMKKSRKKGTCKVGVHFCPGKTLESLQPFNSHFSLFLSLLTHTSSPQKHRLDGMD